MRNDSVARARLFGILPLASGRGRAVSPHPAHVRADDLESYRDDVERLDIELAEIDATVNALLSGLVPANLPLVNDRLTQLRHRRERLQRERRAAATVSRPFDELAIRRWATERIAGLAGAIDGRRNEHVRRVLTSYVDEIVIWPSTKTGLLRVSALAPGLDGGLAGPQNNTDRPAGDRSCVDRIAGAGFEPATSGL